MVSESNAPGWSTMRHCRLIQHGMLLLLLMFNVRYIHVVVHYTSFYLSKVWRSQILHQWIYIIIDASCVDANIINSSSIDASIIIFCIHILVIVIIIYRYYWYTLCRFRLGSVQIWVRLYFMIILKSDQLLSDQNLSKINGKKQLNKILKFISKNI